MNNDSAHECAVNLLKEDVLSLQNTRVEFLLVNTTSLFQPLDQGIIKNLKALYWQFWLCFMVDISLSMNKNPVKEVNMLWACRWIVNAWNEVQPSTIDHCWCKSTLFGPYQGAQRRPTDYHDIVHDIQQLGEQLQQAGRIQALININNFIDPIEKTTEDELENIVEHVAAQFGPEKNAESDEEEAIEQPKMKIS